MRLQNVKMLLCWPSKKHIYGSVGPLLMRGYQRNLHFNGSIGPLKSIFMAPLALFNEGVPAHFFHLMEVPTMRLPNVKILLCWSSRMHIYGFV